MWHYVDTYSQKITIAGFNSGLTILNLLLQIRIKSLVQLLSL